MVTGSFTLVGIEDMYAYIITCSSGSTIPTKADGTCKAAVTVNFKKKTDEGLVVYAAPKVIISVQNSSGTALSTETYNNRNAVDVTEMINSTGITANTMEVSLYDESLLLASENFYISRDTDVYTIESSVGAAIQCDENGNVIGSVVLTHYKNSTETSCNWIVSLYDNSGGIGFFVLKNGVSQFDITNNINNAKTEHGRVPNRILASATCDGNLTQLSLSVTYRNAVPIAGTMPWAESNTYQNGNYIEYDGLIYMWTYPIAGNSTLNPKDDVAQNGETTHWKAYQLWDLLATKVLLAEFAKVGQAVFQGNYMLSQQGTDADGNPSSSYDKFNPSTNAFNPNILLDFMTGKAILNDLEANGSVSTKRDGRRIMIDAKTNTVKMISESETGYFESLVMGFTEVVSSILPYIKLINTLGEKLNISPTSITLNKENSTSLTLTRSNINLSNTTNDNSVVLAADSLKVTGVPDGGDPVYKNKSTTITSDGIESRNLVSNDSIRITPDRVTISNGSEQSISKTFEILVRGRYPGDSVDQDDQYIILKFMNGFLVLE